MPPYVIALLPASIPRSRRTEAECGPHVIECNLANGLQSARRQQRGQRVPIQVGSELARLRIRNPRQTILRRGLDNLGPALFKSGPIGDKDEQRRLLVVPALTGARTQLWGNRIG